MKKLLVLFPILLSACVHNEVTRDITTPEMKKPVIDARLLVECEKPGYIKDNPRPSDVLKQHGADIQAFKDCADSKKKLIEAIRPMIGN